MEDNINHHLAGGGGGSKFENYMDDENANQIVLKTLDTATKVKRKKTF